MKLYIALCILLTLSFKGYTQPPGIAALEDQQFDEQFAKRTIPEVTGKLLHLSAEELAKTTIGYSVVTLSGQVRKTASVDADGSFKLELDYPLPYQQIWLNVEGIFYAGIYANKDLHVELDTKKIKASGEEVSFNGPGVRYLGTDGPLTAYMNDYVLFRRPEQQALHSKVHNIPRSSKPVAANVLASYGAIFDSLKMIQDDYIAKHPSPYGWLLENERLSDFYGQISVHYWNNAMEDALFNKMKEHKTYLISNASVDFAKYMSIYFLAHPVNRIKASWKDVAVLSDLSPAEKAAVDSLSKAATLSPTHPYTVENTGKWTKQLQNRLQKIQHDQTIHRCIQIYDSIFPSSRADFMKLQLNDSKDIVEQQSTLEQILPGMRTAWCQLLAKTEYTRTVDKIANVNKALASSGNSITATGFGKPLQQTDFGASLYKISGMNGSDFLANLKKSFPGKAIVFDLWATWCMPCLAEMPHSKKLQEDGKDLPVVFVYVCTSKESNETKWKTKVAELKLPGIHFYIDNELDAQLAQYFSFSGYPGYAFIDRSGVYRAGAIKRISEVKDRAALAVLVK